MPFPSVTYNFSNGSTADADAVDQNFTDIINGISDGTKDISVSAGTFAGNVSISGNTTLGNASSDDITFTGSMASTLPIKTTNTYDIGSTTLGLRALYFGANSQTVKLQGSSSMSATWTFTFPVTAGTSTYVLQTDGSGVGSWVSKTKLSITAKTTTYTATIDDDVITCSTGSAWTLTLPAASTATGKVLEIKKTSSDLNGLTIDGNASETIDGATTVILYLQYEAIKIVCDGSNWFIIDRTIPTVYVEVENSAGTALSGSDATNVLTYPTEVADSHGCFSSTVFTAPRPGKYIVNAYQSLVSVVATARVIVTLRKNGSSYRRLAFKRNDTGGASSLPNMGETATVSLAKNDTLDVTLVYDDASSRSLEGNGAVNWLTIKSCDNY
jgi:hypothetical protein